MPADWLGNTCVAIPRIAKTSNVLNVCPTACSKRDGGCNFAFDPDTDARDAAPIWTNIEKKQIQLTAVDDDTENCELFEFWQLPGRKCLTHDGACLCARIQTARESIHVRLGSNLASGKRFGYVLPENGRLTESLKALGELSALYHRVKSEQTSAVINRPTRSAVYHFRALQALDGVSVGASQREIAVALVGEETVAAEWSADSSLRAHVRAMIHRGQRLIDGGYRRLVDVRAAQGQGGIE
jgi:hypothetical protein